MRYLNKQLIFAPTDLSRWLGSPYSSWMSRYAVEVPDAAPSKDEPDALLQRLANRGLAHEDALETRFVEEGLTVINIAKELGGINYSDQGDRHAAAYQLTLEHLRGGADVIAQATLERDDFRGYADFLIKVPGASALGEFHYEVWDTKLARRVKPGMVLQLCCYVDMLELIQKRMAEHIVVALGNDENERVPLVHCFDYYQAVKKVFIEEQRIWSIDEEPDPAEHTDYGDWSSYAAGKLEASDHLGRVARITHKQIERLNEAGVSSMTQLAQFPANEVPGIDTSRLEWLVRQAALQHASKITDIPDHHILDKRPDSTTGLQLLPDASVLDVFFDIEGFPLESEGLEYLWGCTYHDSAGEQAFRDWWAHDRQEEKQAFEGFIDWVYERWQKNSSMHIYHYAPYEITACRRLIGAHDTRERKLDQLLRNGVFVDLYSIVLHSIQVGTPNYSIKSVERLYRAGRNTDVASGGDSVVMYDLWREAHASGEEGSSWQQSEMLADIRAYNRDDCDSTLELYQWLCKQKSTPPNSAQTDSTTHEEYEQSDATANRLELRDRLLKKAGQMSQAEDNRDKSDCGSSGQQVSSTLLQTLAGVLEFHRREEKNTWWRYFDRINPANTALADDPDCLATCERTDREGFKPTLRARNLAWEYKFDVFQEFREITSEVYLKGFENDDGKARKVNVLRDHSDLEQGLIVIQSALEPPDTLDLVPNEIVIAKPIPEAINDVVEKIEAGNSEYSALRDVLHRAPPRIQNHDGGPIVQSPASMLEDTIKAVLNLDNSTLIIQGPPGAGKSYTGARIIAALVQQGKKVGICSNSHKAIDNLIIGAARYCNEKEIEGCFLRNKGTSDVFETLGIQVVGNGHMAAYFKSRCVVGTTAWGFAREDFKHQFDVLVIDEAGQVALASLIGISRAASNLVIMGDQRQLGQPIQGSHPAESGQSVLEYRLGNTAAIAPEQGVFLGTTWRMHPAVNAPLSRYIYNGKLETADVTATRVLCRSGDSITDREAGLVYLPVEHEGNQLSSEEEACAIAAAVNILTERRIRLDDGTTRKLTIDDMLFVAPYNAQVVRLQKRLGEGARVGSVDRFQGQEAAVVFLSLCSSDASGSPRGIRFLLDENRLNVAVSRAQTLCVIVGHPRLATTRVASLADLRRVNFLSALMAAGR